MSSRRSQNGFRRYVGLALVLAAREFPGAYRGNATGALAAIVIPLAMLGVYSFVFSTLIPVELDPSESGSSYTLFLFSGLIVWNLFSDVVVRGPKLFVGAANYVHRPQFPISLLVLAPCLASLFRSLPWLAAYLGVFWLTTGGIAWPSLATPLVLVMACLLTFGTTLLMASLGAIVRDLGDFIQPAVTLLFFLSPILYPAATIGAKADWVLLVNPLAPLLELMRDLSVAQVVPDPALVVQLGLISAGSIGVGLLAYVLVRRSLADLV